jgi:acyl-CoA thioester hydrolase
MGVTTTVRVRYAETDQMGIVYYANYLAWFEVGRVEYLRNLGYEYKQMEEADGAILPVVEATCRYRSPARYDDLIEIEVTPLLLRGAVLKFGYQIYRSATEQAERQLLAEGETTHVVCDRELNKRPLPERVAEPMRQAIHALKHSAQS